MISTRRIVLKSNSHSGQQDRRDQDARSSWETTPASRIFTGKICNRNRGLRNIWSTSFCSRAAGYTTRRQGQEVDREVREPPAQGIFPLELEQTQKINMFSRESQDLIADWNNTEIFELCKNSSKQQCLECNAYWEMGIVYCSCGRKMKSTRSPTECDQNKQLVNPGMDDITSILERWHKDDQYRNSLPLVGWTEEQIESRRCSTSTQSTSVPPVVRSGLNG